MNHKDVMCKLRELVDASEEANARYLEYLKAVVAQRKAAEALFNATEDIINLPHIEVYNFEIDG